jgi:phosphopantetheine adenylyltransferase
MVTPEIVGYESTVEQDRAWLSIPMFASRFAWLSYEQRMDLLEKAYQKVDKSQVSTTRWLLVTAAAD